MNLTLDEFQKGMETMRRLLVPLTALGLLGLVIGCRTGMKSDGDCGCTCGSAPSGIIAPHPAAPAPGTLIPPSGDGAEPIAPPKNGKAKDMPPIDDNPPQKKDIEKGNDKKDNDKKDNDKKDNDLPVPQ